MDVLRYLTLVWPGMPWLWLRGSRSGLVLALAFAVTLDVAMLATFVWPELLQPAVTMAIWSAMAAIWLIATGSALVAFPPSVPGTRGDAADALFVQARDAYLARDWLTAESRLEALLAMAPTDGEAQLLWGTLLRRVGRHAEARAALAKLSRSDSGTRWRTAVRREFALLDAASGRDQAAADTAILPLHAAEAASPRRDAA